MVVDRRHLAGHPDQGQHDEPVLRVPMQRVPRVAVRAAHAVAFREPPVVGHQALGRERDLADDHRVGRAAVENVFDGSNVVVQAVGRPRGCGHRGHGREDGNLGDSRKALAHCDGTPPGSLPPAPSTMKTIRTLLPCLLLLAACSTHSAIEQSEHYAHLGDYNRAYEVLEDERQAQLSSGGTVDAELEAAHASAKKAYLLWRARQRIFREREDEALADLDLLDQLSPGYPEADVLRQRALVKKAMHAVERGDEFLRNKDLESALAQYIEAEHSVPGFEPAVKGSEEVHEAMLRLTKRAQQQFLEAVRKLPEFKFIEVRWHSTNALENDPAREDAGKLKERANGEIAQNAFKRAKENEQRGLYGAALLEYKTAQRLDPSLAGVADSIAQMKREVEAAGLIERAQVAMRAGKFDEANEDLGEAFDLSVMARGTISELMIQARRKEGESRYQLGRDAEILGKKQDALTAYEALSKDWPDGLLDEKARIAGLRADIEGAQREWAAAEAAEAAGDLAQAIEHYRNSEQFYAGWKDGKARIERLREQIARTTNGGTSGG
ncbi:MAG TPA: hypothetical protein VFZ65_11130 [Planctomycetota bacterium]|nr:hypothetical protein [Planctomycetota bacterium]